MHRTNIWDKLLIYSSKIILLFLLLPFTANAQYKGAGRFAYENDLKFQSRKFHFGIVLGVNSSNFKVNLSQEFVDSSTFLTINAQNGGGFNLGLLTSFHLHKYLELRTLPTVSFMEKTLRYGLNNGTTTDKKLEQIFIEMPIQFKFKSEPISNFKIYVLGGLKYGFDVASNSKARNAEELIKLSKHDLAVDYGLGLEMHFPLFILSPEFKVSNSILNNLSPDDSLNFSRALKALHNRVFLFSIIFEG